MASSIVPNPLNIPHPTPRDWDLPTLVPPTGRFEDLGKFLVPTPQGRSRHSAVLVSNETPPERNAVIVSAGVEFIFPEKRTAPVVVPPPPTTPPPSRGARARAARRPPPSPSVGTITLPPPPVEPDPFADRLSYMSGPTDVEIYSGRSAVFRMTDPRHTVIEVRLGILVRLGYEGREPYFMESFFSYWNPSAERVGAPFDKHLIADAHFEFRVLEDPESIASPRTYFELRRVKRP